VITPASSRSVGVVRVPAFLAMLLCAAVCAGGVGGGVAVHGATAAAPASPRQIRPAPCNPVYRARATRALRAIRRDASGKIKVERDRCGFVSEFQGDLPAGGPGSSRRVLDRYAAAFGLRSTWSELRVNSTTGPSEDLEQVYRRVPLALSPRVTVLFHHRDIVSVGSDACPYVRGRIGSPRVSRSHAVAIARRAVKDDPPPPTRPRRVVYPLRLTHPCSGGRSVLAWETWAGHRTIWIDAKTGRVLRVGELPLA
jgi:hypothetical protein